MDFVIDNIGGTAPAIAIFILSMLPVIELRGGILLGMALGMPWIEVFIICLIGNILPIPFLILFGRYVINCLERTQLLGGYIRGYKQRLIEHSDAIQKYGPIGLILFVGIPIPGTGAWSGALIALLLDLRLAKAVPCILIGIILAGVIMTLGALGLLGLFTAFVGAFI